MYKLKKKLISLISNTMYSKKNQSKKLNKKCQDYQGHQINNKHKNHLLSASMYKATIHLQLMKMIDGNQYKRLMCQLG